MNEADDSVGTFTVAPILSWTIFIAHLIASGKPEFIRRPSAKNRLMPSSSRQKKASLTEKRYCTGPWESKNETVNIFISQSCRRVLFKIFQLLELPDFLRWCFATHR